MEISSHCSKKTQPARGWNAADICTNCVYTIPAPRDGGPIPFLGKSAVVPCRLAGSAPHKSGGCPVKSWPDDTHNKHTPVIWIYDMCHKQINKKQISIRCNHTHWVYLKYTQIKQRQYKPDWRCIIHTPTQNVTTLSSTDDTTSHHKQTTIHSLKNITISININPTPPYAHT